MPLFGCSISCALQIGAQQHASAPGPLLTRCRVGLLCIFQNNNLICRCYPSTGCFTKPCKRKRGDTWKILQLSLTMHFRRTANSLTIALLRGRRLVGVKTSPAVAISHAAAIRKTELHVDATGVLRPRRPHAGRKSEALFLVLRGLGVARA